MVTRVSLIGEESTEAGSQGQLPAPISSIATGTIWAEHLAVRCYPTGRELSRWRCCHHEKWRRRSRRQLRRHGKGTQDPL